MIFSCVIPVSDDDRCSLKLSDLVESIRGQDFPQDQVEILAISEGDSEQAKAIGIRKAKGEICVMLCADNKLISRWIFSSVKKLLDENSYCVGLYSRHYAAFVKGDNSLNRYFSLIGANDPIPFYLGKADRLPWYKFDKEISHEVIGFVNGYQPTIGDNGFFFKRDMVDKKKLDNYYIMEYPTDRLSSISYYIRLNTSYLWHRTSDNLFTFLKKRYKYARDLYCDRQNRQWKMLSNREDYIRLLYFIFCTVTVIPCFMVSARGFTKIRDKAWFLHPIVCWGFLITYGILACRNLLKFQSLFQQPGRRAYVNA